MEIFAFYNVENLFLPDSKPNHKSEKTNSGLFNWDFRKYQYKLNKISHAFRLIEEQHQQLPFMIGLAEVSGEHVLKDLIQSEPLQGRYGILHYKSLDERNVDVALLYDHSKIKVLESEPITFFFEESGLDEKYYDTTRDVLFAKVKYEDEIINVFVLHLPSKREKDVNKPKRAYILQELRNRITEIQEISDEKVIVCGDFNENPDDEVLEILSDKTAHNKALENPFSDLFFNRQYSTYHYKSGLLFDQILLSQNFYKPEDLLQFEAAEVFNHQQLTVKSKLLSGRPFRTFAGTRYLGGYSDHFPVLIKLKTKHIH
ncbi:endonuclease [Chryseobacterium sp. Leaf404]|uniref:endonuclease/exonuclease/phosphatase family protein n=1 Tax=unclassified Chryseobacterium TaxID=2593645 RepID=UPI0006FAEACC|nr:MULTISPECIES: endonuclease/exonuclease/phosphatase family protein [unclassified Chryseobacterium]KQT16403.1 endonuclease [Chryseobacterium sp. Leaf404]